MGNVIGVLNAAARLVLNPLLFISTPSTPAAREVSILNAAESSRPVDRT
jgi:hypothetical protein